MNRINICELCGRETNIHPHHLIPKKFLKRKQTKKLRKRMKGVLTSNPLVYVCQDCEKMVHALFRLSELLKKYNTVELLKSNGNFRKYLKWVKNKPVGIVKHPKRSWKGGKYE